MQFKLELCTKNDVETIQKIGRETFYETFIDQNDPAMLDAYLAKAFAKHQIEKELLHPSSRFFIATVEGEVAGYLKVNVADAQTDDMGDQSLQVERIYIRRAFQKHGIGKVLMNKAIEIAKAEQKEKIWLGVWEKNANAIAFYKKVGFEKTSTYSFYMGDEEQTDWIMAKPLQN